MTTAVLWTCYPRRDGLPQAFCTVHLERGLQPATTSSASSDLGLLKVPGGACSHSTGYGAGGQSWPEPGAGSLLYCLGTGPSPPAHPPTAHTSTERASPLPPTRLPLPSAGTAQQPALLMMHVGILGQRGGVTQLTASQVLPLVSRTCRPLPVTARLGQRGESEPKPDLRFCKVLSPSGFCAGSFHCTSYIPQSWPSAHTALSKAPKNSRTGLLGAVRHGSWGHQHLA